MDTWAICEYTQMGGFSLSIRNSPLVQNAFNFSNDGGIWQHIWSFPDDTISGKSRNCYLQWIDEETEGCQRAPS